MKKGLNIMIMNRSRFDFRNLLVLSATLWLMLLPVVSAQNENTATTQGMTGIVVDAYTKKPVVAAQISVPARNLSAVTDENGQFTLPLSASFDVMHVTAIDYNLREVAIRGRQHVEIALYSTKFSNYYRNITDATGSTPNSQLVSSVKMIESPDRNTAISADELMQSSFGADMRAVTRSAIPGIGASLFIRGLNSLNANAQPLFVVDDVIWNNLYDVESIHNGFYSNPLDVIDINDIESISVLKDGTSIYGSKAANGVVLIKTRRAKSMVTRITLNVLAGVTERPGNLPMMTGDQFRVYASDMLQSKGVTPAELSQYGFLETNPANARVYGTSHNNTDWSDEVYQNGVSNNYLINTAGGDEKALYYFSLGYGNVKSVVKNTDFERILARFNADFKLIDELDLGLNIGFNRISRSLVDDGMDQNASPVWVSQVKSPFLNPYTYTILGEKTRDFDKYDEFGISNPSGLIYAKIGELTKYRFNLGLKPVLRINNNLTLSSMFDYSVDKTVEDRFLPMKYSAPVMVPDKGISYNEINSQVMRNTSFFDETRLTYDKKIDDMSKIKATYGFRFISNYYESDYAEVHNSGSNNNTTISASYQYLTVDGLNNKTKSLSNYLNVDYSFDNKYFVNGVVSMDASSRFGHETEGGIQLLGASWGVFPAVNGAWLISSEPFMKNVDFVNFAKLRAGYGLTGNDGIADYESMAYFSSVRWHDRAMGLVLSNLENSKIQWETTARANVGLDLGLFNERLNLGIDLFNSNTSDLLVLRTLPDISGLGSYWANGGEMNNKGFELSMNLKVLNLPKFKWEIGASAGHYSNKITSLPEGDYTTKVYDGEVLTAVGQPVGSFYGYKSLGVFATEAQATAADLKIRNIDGTFTPFEAGDVQFEEVLVDGVIDENDRQVIGNPNPDLYGAFNSKFTYNRWSLNAVFTYSYGNDVYNYYRSQLESGKNFNNQTAIMNTRWTAENQNTLQPRATYGDPLGNARFSNRWIEDGSYLRLKNVTLSYELPVKSDYIQGVNIWASANNLLTFTKYLGHDPEFSARNSVYYQGIDAGLLPQTRSYFVGLRLNL